MGKKSAMTFPSARLEAAEVSATPASDAADREVLFQVSLLQGLMLGDFEGSLPIGELKKHGDIGLGTFTGVNGEMIVLGDSVYRAAGDGSVEVASDDERVPFAAVTFFDADESEALDGPIDKIIAIRITAQRYQTFETVSPNNIQSLVVARTPEPGRRIVLKEWARRADVRTRVVKVDANGKTTAVDGTGETLAHDLSAEPSLGGGLDSAPGSAFDVDAQEQASGAAFDAVDAALAPSGAPTVGGGLSGF